MNDLFVQEVGGGGIPSVFLGKEMTDILALCHWLSRNFIQKMKVVVGWVFFPAADRKWDKLYKRKLFAFLFFLPNCSRERQNRARQVGQL